MTDDPDSYSPDHIEVAPIDDEAGLNIFVRDEAVLTISWKQAQSLNVLLCAELDEWLHRQGKWSMEITQAGPVHLPAGQADAFADDVIAEAQLDEEAADEVRPALTEWFDRWATPPDNEAR